MKQKPSQLVKERADALAIRVCVTWLMAAEFRRNGADPQTAAKEWHARAKRMSSELAFPVEPVLSDALAQEWLEGVESLIGAALGRSLRPERPPKRR